MKLSLTFFPSFSRSNEEKTMGGDDVCVLGNGGWGICGWRLRNPFKTMAARISKRTRWADVSKDV